MCGNNWQDQLLFSIRVPTLKILCKTININNKTPNIEVNEPIVQIVFKELYISG